MKAAVRWGFLVVALGLLVWAVVATWPQFSAAVVELSWTTVAAALLACIVALLVNALSWRAVMRSVGLDATIVDSQRVFLLSQVGKYVPGSVWPVIAQAEFARDYGISRSRAMTGSIVAMVIGVATAGIVGSVGLVLSAPGTLGQYWWVVLATIGFALLLVPQVLSRIVALAFRLTRRAEQPARITARPIVESMLWSLLMWGLLGMQAWLLLEELAPGAGFLLAAGAFAFAWLVGFLVVVAPAGVGAREAALVLALGTVADPGTALTLALISRFLMTAADAVGFGIGVGIHGARRRRIPGPEA